MLSLFPIIPRLPCLIYVSQGFRKGQGGKRQGGERRQIFIKPGWPEEASEEVIPMAEKKKEEKKAAAQEIPDELPSLAEDILTSGPAAESKGAAPAEGDVPRSEEHTSELQ